jgi:hypothetical protein
MVFLGELAEDAPRLVGTTIVDENDLVPPGYLRQCSGETPVEVAEALGAVVDGYNDADLRVTIHAKIPGG